MMGDLDFDVIARTWPYLLSGLRYTIQLTVVAAIGGIIFGTLLAMARLSRFKPLAMAAAAYVNVMRSVPLLLVIFWFYFLVPVELQMITGAEYPIQMGADRSAYITFIMFEAAYFCEIVRAGIQSIPIGQVHASSALVMNYRQTMQIFVLPNAYINTLPVLLSHICITIHDD